MTKKEEREYYEHVNEFIERLESTGEHIIFNKSDLTTFVLRQAISLKDVYSIKRFCEAGYNFNTSCENDYGYTFPVFFTVLNDYSIFSLISDYIDDIDDTDSNGNTALMITEDLLVTEDLIEKYYCDIDAENDNNETALYLAVTQNNIEKVKLLLENGADADCIVGDIEEHTDSTPLFEAETKEMITLLLEYGATDYNVGEKNINRFAKACVRDEIEIIALLLKNQDINEIFISYDSEDSKECALNLALAQDNYKTVKYLLLRGADVNLVCESFNPIQVAATYNAINSIKILIEYGAVIDSSDYAISPLTIACNMGNIEIVKYLIENGADINTECVIGTPLIAATSGNHIEVVDILISNNVDLFREDGLQRTAEDIAIENGYIEILEKIQSASKAEELCESQLLKMERKLVKMEYTLSKRSHLKDTIEYQTLLSNFNNLKDTFGSYSEHQKILSAIQNNDVLYCKYLIEKGFDVNTVTEKNESLLYVAVVYFQSLDIIKLLLASGADMYLEDNNGQGPMCFICSKGYMEILDLFIKAGIDVNYEYKKSGGMTALMLAGANGHYEICETLLEHGADVNYVANNSFFPLYVTAQKGFLNVIKLYKKYNVSFGNVNKNDYSALMTAAYFNQKEIVEYLLEQGDLVESKTQSSFILACQAGNKEVAEFLFKEGANINFIDKDGSALHNAIRENKKDIVEYLLSIGIDTTIINSAGKLAIDIAREREFFEYLPLLENVSNKDNIKIKELQNKDLLKANTVVSKIVFNQGKEIFLLKNKQKFVGLISDYLEKNQELSQILKTIITTGLLQKLYDADKLDIIFRNEIRDSVIEGLRNELYISEKNVENMISIFTNALGWDE